MSKGPQGTAELRLLETLQQNPGLKVVELARVVGGCRSVTGDRLRQLARDGKVEKDAGGHWQIAAPVAAEPKAAEPERPRPAPGAKPSWIRNVNEYVRAVTSELQGVRYG